jgi:hypothetical protein
MSFRAQGTLLFAHSRPVVPQLASRAENDFAEEFGSFASSNHVPSCRSGLCDGAAPTKASGGKLEAGNARRHE